MVTTDAAAPRILAGSLYTAAAVTIAALAAWPIYRSPAFVLLVAVSAAVAATIVSVAQRRGWSGWSVAAAIAAAFFLVGVPLAVPAALTAPEGFGGGFIDLLAGAVVGWKDLVTVDLPVGSYRNLLVPALVVFLVGTAAVLRLSWRADHVAYGAVPVAFAMTGFGILFGRLQASAPVAIGPVVIDAPVETALGLALLVVSILWLAWRSRTERVGALRRAARVSGVRVPRQTLSADRRRTALGAGMVVAALVAAVAVVPLTAHSAPRTVLRSVAAPPLDLSAQISPLSEHRALFADDRAGEVLFTVETAGADVDRVRIATLDTYSGEVFRTSSTSTFARVPAARAAAEGEPAQVTVTIGDLSGVWMPTAGDVSQVSFAGPRAAALADGFYYSPELGAAIQATDGGLSSGDAYVIDAAVAASVPVPTLRAPAAEPIGPEAPPALREWVERHRTGTDGAALAGLVSLLRERGYLSHGLTADRNALWAETLPGYAFQPSAAGHSLARVDAMFASLLEREDAPAGSASLVAAVGDDEQFAAAAALIAGELGFPARVVVGVRLDAAPGLAQCDDGQCRTTDVTAWVEVQSADGRWTPIDVTPQFERSPSLDVAEQRDPEVVSPVDPDTVDDVEPPAPQQAEASDDSSADAGTEVDAAALWAIARVGAIVLLAAGLVAGPFLAIGAAKALRRRSRRGAAATGTRVAGAWEEYLDTLADHGREFAPQATRRETALAVAGDDPRAQADALAFADVVDRAAFAGVAPSAGEAAEAWRGLEQQRRRLREESGGWRSAVATVSLRSFLRALTPAPGSARPSSERGRRTGSSPVRPA
jgi:hypothetical protein